MLACCHARWRADGLAGVPAILRSCWSAVRLDREVAGEQTMPLARLVVQLLVGVVALPFACVAWLIALWHINRRADDPDE